MNDATSRSGGGNSFGDGQHAPVSGDAWKMLTFNTLAFTICFAAWMMSGVLMTFLKENASFARDWDPVSLGWLIGIPVLTGAVMRLPLGILTDKYGGRWV